MQDLSVQAEFDATVATLAATVDWRKTKSFAPLKRKHAGLGEVRFSVRTKRHGKETVRRFRLAGIWREQEAEFIFLIGSEKAHGIYTPSNAFDLAVAYKAKLENGEGEICEHY